jgi:hypothetical protein
MTREVAEKIIDALVEARMAVAQDAFYEAISTGGVIKTNPDGSVEVISKEDFYDSSLPLPSERTSTADAG